MAGGLRPEGWGVQLPAKPVLCTPPWKRPALMGLCKQVTLPWSDAGAEGGQKTPLWSPAWFSIVPCSWAQHDYTACAQPGHCEDQRAAWGMKMSHHSSFTPLFRRAAPKSQIPLALLWFMFTGHKAVNISPALGEPGPTYSSSYTSGCGRTKPLPTSLKPPVPELARWWA